jgi:hypothetical protein
VLENQPFETADLNVLAKATILVPGSDSRTPLIAVSRNGVTTKGVARSLGPDDLIDAWN